jgi:hypothetical protein
MMPAKTFGFALVLIAGLGQTGCIVEREHPHPVYVERPVVVHREWVEGYRRPDGVFVDGYWR